MQSEKRATAGVSANGRKLTGYVAKFDTPTTIGGGFTETIKRGAFAASLASDRDIIAMADHDPARVLGRTKSGSLTLREDETRSEERRVGKECVRTCRSRWPP